MEEGADTCNAVTGLLIPIVQYLSAERWIINVNIRLLTCAVTPSYFERTEEMFTCGTMFFSTESWNSGGGGRSTARKRKGDTVGLMSAWNRISIYR